MDSLCGSIVGKFEKGLSFHTELSLNKISEADISREATKAKQLDFHSYLCLEPEGLVMVGLDDLLKPVSR